MKKHLALLLALVLVLGLAVPSYAAGAAAQVGIIKAFTEKSVTICVNGKDAVYTIDAKTIVTQAGDAATFMNIAKKGLKATFKVSGKKLTEIDIPNSGGENRGALEFRLNDVRVLVTESCLPVAANSVREDAGEVENTRYATYGDPTTIDIGNIDIVPNTLKVLVNGQEVKIIDAKTEFDKTTVGDEVKLTPDADDPTYLRLVFEKKLVDADTVTAEELEKILSVSYKQKMYKMTTTDVTKAPVSEDVVVELNGKEVSFVKALNRANYCYVTLNAQGEIAYMNTFYNDLECTVNAIDMKKNTITISVLRDGKVAYTDTLAIGDVTAFDAKGEVIALSSIKANDKVKLTVDPYAGYKVITITK